jgi:hypothetical protein
MVTRAYLVTYHTGMSGGRAFLDGTDPVTQAQVETWEADIGTDTGNHPVAVTNVLPLGEPVPCPDTVALAAKRAGRWARDNTALTAAQIIDLDLAIRDLAGPT